MSHPTLPTGLQLCALLAGSVCLLFQAFGTTQAEAAAAVAVDNQEGYSGKILDKVSAVWAPPPGLKGEFQIRLKASLDGSGKVLRCAPVKSSGVEALDISACGAVNSAGPYGTPPYGMPLDIYLHFWTGTPKGPARPDVLSTEEALRAEVMARAKAEQAMGKQQADNTEARARARAEAAALSAGQSLPELEGAPVAPPAPASAVAKAQAQAKGKKSAVPAAGSGGGVIIKAPRSTAAAPTEPAGQAVKKTAVAASDTRDGRDGRDGLSAEKPVFQAQAAPQGRPVVPPAPLAPPAPSAHSEAGQTQSSTAQAADAPKGRVVQPVPPSAGGAGLPLADGLKAQDKFEPKYRKYLAGVAYALREAMFIPAETAPGTYYATARITVTPEGKITNCTLTESSGDPLLDKYVTQGIRRAGSVETPPAGIGKTLEITFTLVRR